MNIVILIVALSFLEMLISILVIHISTNFETRFLAENLKSLFNNLKNIQYVDFFNYESGNIFPCLRTIFTKYQQ